MSNDRQFVEALARGLNIIDCFAPSRPVLTNGELARLTGLPCSSVSRLTHTLVKLGYLEYDSALGAYRLGLKVLPIHTAMIAATDVKSLVLPYMERLAAQATARVILAACEEGALVVMQAADGRRLLASPLSIGASYPIAGSAMGRAYLAACSQAEQDAIFERLLQAGAITQETLAAELLEAKTSYAAHGYCTSLQDWRRGVHGVAVPIHLENLGRRVVLSCAAPVENLPLTYIRDVFGPMMVRCAKEISSASSRPRSMPCRTPAQRRFQPQAADGGASVTLH
jgi:DNA-binding IclR family transcriptional regulator